MAVVVEHDKRKREILDKSLDIFIEEGYEDVTFQKIADRCGITRTTLYIYFKNKREIFLWSIKQLTQGLEDSLQHIILDKTASARQRLSMLMKTVIEKCVDNRRLFSVVLYYLLQLQKTGKDPGERVRRRIVRLRHLLTTLIIEGQKNGEFKSTNVKSLNEMLYGLIEASIFRLAILDQKDVEEIIGAVDLAVEGICLNKE